MAAHPGHAHHPREFDQFNTTGRMMRGKRGLKVSGSERNVSRKVLRLAKRVLESGVSPASDGLAT